MKKPGPLTKAGTPRVNAPGAGRPFEVEAGEVMKPRAIRMSEAQYEKLQGLGGAAWVRRKIDAAK